MAQTYTVGAIGIAFGNNKSMAAVFNGSGSGRVLRVYRIWVLNNQTSGVTGVLTTWALRRITGASGGSAITPTKHDTNSEAMPAQVAVVSGTTPTIVAGDVSFRNWVWSNDEPAASGATSDEFECLVPLNCIWDSTGSSDLEPLVLREGYGITVQHTGSTTVGVVDIFIEFTMANS